MRMGKGLMTSKNSNYLLQNKRACKKGWTKEELRTVSMPRKAQKKHASNAVKISLVILVYNAGKDLRKALDSVLTQTLADFEAICVDTRSADCSLDILKEYAKKDKRIIPLFGNSKISVSQARKDGLHHSSGQYVMFLDSGDFLSPNALEAAYAAIKENDTDLVQFGTVLENHGKLSNANILSADKHLNLGAQGASKGDLISVCFTNELERKLNWILTNKIYRADICKKVFTEIQNGFSSCAEDLYAVFLYLYNAKSYACIEEKLYHRCLDLTSMKSPVNLDEFASSLHSVDTFLAIKKLLSHSVNTSRCCDDEISQIQTILISENFKLWMRLPDHLKAQALEMMSSAWSKCISTSDSESGLQSTVEKLLEFSPNTETTRYVKGAKYISEWYDKTHSKAPNDFRVIKDNRQTKEPKVSVIIPIYNTAPYLTECLTSIRDQTLCDIEVICVNDGSTDNSLELLKYFAKDDDRFVLCTQSNTGRGTARNRGIAQARGRYIYFMDSDDLLETDALNQLYTQADEKKLDVLLFDATCFAADSDIEGKRLAEENKNNYIRTNAYDDVYLGIDLLNRMCVNHDFSCSMPLEIIRRELLVNSGIIFPDGIIHEDEPYAVEVLCRAKRVSHLNKTFFHRRYRANSTMTKMRSFADAYGYFRCFIIIANLLSSISADAPSKDAVIDCMKVMLSLSRNKFSALSPEEKLAVKGLPLEERNSFEAYISDWTKEHGYGRYTEVLYARIDIKNGGADSNDAEVIDISDAAAEVGAPAWMRKNGNGRMIKSGAGTLSFKVKCKGDGKLSISLKGEDVRNAENKRIPIWVDYTKLSVNGKTIFDAVKPAWHDAPQVYSMDVKDGQVIVVQAEWLPDCISVGSGFVNAKKRQDAALSNAKSETQKARKQAGELKLKLKDSINPRTVAHARIDIKNGGAASNDVEVLDISNAAAKVEAPAWMRKNGNGRIITGEKGTLELKLKCKGDGRLVIALRGRNVKSADKHRIPVWVSYTRLVIDEKVIFDTISPAWHDRPMRFAVNVKDGQIVHVQVKWDPKRITIGSGMEDVMAELSNIRSSMSFRIGRVITYIPRKILKKRFGRCL